MGSGLLNVLDILAPYRKTAGARARQTGSDTARSLKTDQSNTLATNTKAAAPKADKIRRSPLGNIRDTKSGEDAISMERQLT
jgi:hypothetical protein